MSQCTHSSFTYWSVNFALTDTNRNYKDWVVRLRVFQYSVDKLCLCLLKNCTFHTKTSYFSTLRLASDDPTLDSAILSSLVKHDAHLMSHQFRAIILTSLYVQFVCVSGIVTRTHKFVRLNLYSSYSCYGRMEPNFKCHVWSERKILHFVANSILSSGDR